MNIPHPIPFFLASMGFLMLSVMAVESKSSSLARGITVMAGMSSSLILFFVGVFLVLLRLKPLNREMGMLYFFTGAFLLTIIEVRNQRKKDENLVS